MAIRVLIFHGYLLRGTGSNVYNANVARALAKLGHEVHLLCQDREAPALGWIDAVGDWGPGGLRVEPSPGESPGEGSITAYRPPIGGLLPVYVADRYAGFEARLFSDLSEAELDGYLDANVAAVAEVCERVGEPDAGLANHLVMGPAILARAGRRFAAKVHGSALSYTVRPDPRFLPYARQGMAAASAVLVGSAHTARSLWETVELPGLAEKTRLGPPGVDLEAFAPIERSEASPRLLDLAARIEAEAGARSSAGDSFDRDVTEAASALRDWALARGPRVLYVGKLIVSKGVDLLLAAWPLVSARHRGAELLVVGFGAYREALERLWAAIRAGDLAEARQIAELGWGLEGGERRALPILREFLADPPAGWLDAARGDPGSVRFAGRLEHAEVAQAVSAADATVVPSTFPEAFGMVAAEAAAAGSLPICADHSGLAEVATALDSGLSAAARGLTSFGLAPGAPEAIADRVLAWCALAPAEREAARRELRATVAAHWSWERVAEGVIAGSGGRLDLLDPVPEP